MQFLAQDLRRGQNRQIFGDMNAGCAQFEQLNLFCILAGTKDDAQRRLFARFGLIPVPTSVGRVPSGPCIPA